MTKIELQQANTRLAAELLEAKTQLSVALVECGMLKKQLEYSKPRYPFVDKVGRSYRIEAANNGKTQVKCFAPQQEPVLHQ